MCHDSFRTYHFPTNGTPGPTKSVRSRASECLATWGFRHRRCGKSFKARDFWAGFGSRGWIPKYLIPLGISQADPTAWDGRHVTRVAQRYASSLSMLKTPLQESEAWSMAPETLFITERGLLTNRKDPTT